MATDFQRAEFQIPNPYHSDPQRRLRSLQGDALLENLLSPITYALQPIVSTASGVTHGVEALIRGTDSLGFQTIGAYFDFAAERGVLHSLDLELRRSALSKMRDLKFDGALLFFNLDHRVIGSDGYAPHRTESMLSDTGLSPDRLVFEISEIKQAVDEAEFAAVLNGYNNQGYRLAIDDFGVGISGLKLLYEHRPNYLKIDRFFISGIDKDRERRLFVSTIVGLAQALGITIVAEGVETTGEFFTCREIGCSLVQGFFIAEPTPDPTVIPREYKNIGELSLRARRGRARSDASLIGDEIDRPPTLSSKAKMSTVFDTFRTHKDRHFFPVLNDDGHPLGIVQESALKDYIYSAYGKELLSNPTTGRTLVDFISRCPTAEVDTPIERILQLYAMDENAVGVMIIQEGRYVGMLFAEALLQSLNEKNLAVARDQNPLTKLPGNLSISDTVERLLRDHENSRSILYFDLDNFKPFNDSFGFRLGDRAILLLAERLQAQFGAGTAINGFVGHVGGDDFFVACSGISLDVIRQAAVDALDTFAEDVKTFYGPEDRDRGFILANDRQGQKRRFPLLTCSAAIIHMPIGPGPRDSEALGYYAALDKKSAKSADGHIQVRVWAPQSTT